MMKAIRIVLLLAIGMMAWSCREKAPRLEDKYIGVWQRDDDPYPYFEIYQKGEVLVLKNYVDKSGIFDKEWILHRHPDQDMAYFNDPLGRIDVMLSEEGDTLLISGIGEYYRYFSKEQGKRK